MLQIDSLILEEFFKENEFFFANTRVQKIQQPTRKELILHLRKNTPDGGVSKKLYININPNCHHLCFMSKENESRRNLEIPKQPPMFCMLLRKHMEGARIIKIQKPKYERILELYFENYNEIGDRIEECLSIELMGKHSNIVLYNTDNNTIIGCAHNVGAEKSKERELAGGLPYVYPPKLQKKDLLKTRYEWFLSTLMKSKDTVKKTISNNYFSLSQFVVEELCLKNGIDSESLPINLSEPKKQLLYVLLHEFLGLESREYSVSSDFTKFSCVNELERKYSSINNLIDDYYSFHIEKDCLCNLKNSLIFKINKFIKKLTLTLQNQNKQIEKAEKGNIYLLKGNILMANMYDIKNVVPKVILKNYVNDEIVEIELDETKTVVENANRYFELYNKTKRACQIAKDMAEDTRNELDYYYDLKYAVEIADTIADVKEIQEEINPQLDLQKNKKNKGQINILKFEIDGIDVYVGKNNKQNDYLYSKISSSNDIWFHTLNTPGSHVIAKLPNNNYQLKDDTLLKICKLAKEYSTAKNSTKVSVVYTQRKYIKRPQNTKSGFVVYKNEEEIVV